MVWQATVSGPRGLTPLHLAALLPDAGAMARLLCTAGAAPPSAWHAAVTDDGLTPHVFAARTSDSRCLDAWFCQQGHGLDVHSVQEAPRSVLSQQLQSESACMTEGLSAGSSPPAEIKVARVDPRQQPSAWQPALPAAWALPSQPAVVSSALDSSPAEGQWDEEAALLSHVTGRAWACRHHVGSSTSVGVAWPIWHRPTVAMLGVVACLCTCVVLLRGWTY